MTYGRQITNDINKLDDDDDDDKGRHRDDDAGRAAQLLIGLIALYAAVPASASRVC